MTTAVRVRPRLGGARLALPTGIRACLFDLDGVLTRTVELHAAAWKATFDEFLVLRALRGGLPFVPFDAASDYGLYVDGRPRAEGVRTFLRSRGIELPEAEVERLGDRKNARVLELTRRDGVEVYEGSVRFARAARNAGLQLAVVSSSANCAAVLRSAGIAHLFEVRIDGAYARDEGLAGKPAPDTYLAAAAALIVLPGEAAVFEDALAGVAAARAGGFGYIVGVDRGGHADALLAEGADVVVSDLADLLVRE
jgi:beta-phosphoglucomutase family hydrolase